MDVFFRTTGVGGYVRSTAKTVSAALLGRREFLKGTVCAVAASQAASRMPAHAEGRRLRYVGWQVGLTYQSAKPGGLDRDYCLRLLDEMAANRMNLLSLMMLSYGYYDPGHDGYAWPVKNPALQRYRDTHCINACAETEFIRAIIGAAADRRIAVQLFLNWGIWNPETIRLGYPSAVVQANREGQSPGWLHCPDAAGSWQAGLDEATDLLEYYAHPNVTGFAFERISYQGSDYCYCPHTRARFTADTGMALESAGKDRIEAWKQEHIGGLIAGYVRHVRQVRPGLSIGLHTQCAPGWGHDAARLASLGIDMVLPHTVQFQETETSLHALLHRLDPNPCVLHFCTRDKRPANYNLWVKTPAIIHQVFEWILRYPGGNLAGFLFFNEPATSPANRKAVYENLKRFDW